MIKKILRKIFPNVVRARYMAPYLVNYKNTKRKYYAKSGANTQLFGPLTLEPECIELDDYTRLQPGVRVINSGGRLVVKKFSAIGAGVTIIASEHVPTVGIPQFLSTLHINDVASTVVVEEDAWVGAESILLSHSRIGRGAVVAAGSVVTKPIPPYAVVAGSPARIIKVRFTKEQIMAHEAILYPPEERMKPEDLDTLFETTYKGLGTIGVNDISPEDYTKLCECKDLMGIKNYENGK